MGPRKHNPMQYQILRYLALDKEIHPYALTTTLAKSDKALNYNSIYRPMKRLRQKKYVVSRQAIGINNVEKQIYRLTTKGLIAALGSFYWFNDWRLIFLQ